MAAVRSLFFTLGCAGGALLSSVATAEVSTSDAYLRLRQGLEQEVQLLSGIRDVGTAKEALPALRRNHAELAALKSEVASAELWRYIDNTPHRKGPLVALLQQMTQEFQRLEKAAFFSCDELRCLLEPQLNPSANPA